MVGTAASNYRRDEAVRERYWDDRVFRDRRSWAATGAPRDNDLTATAMDIAHQMLKERGVA